MGVTHCLQCLTTSLGNLDDGGHITNVGLKLQELVPDLAAEEALKVVKGIMSNPMSQPLTSVPLA